MSDCRDCPGAEFCGRNNRSPSSPERSVSVYAPSSRNSRPLPRHTDAKCAANHCYKSDLAHTGEHGRRAHADGPRGDQRVIEPALPLHDEGVLAGAADHAQGPVFERHREVLHGLAKPQGGGGLCLGGKLARETAYPLSPHPVAQVECRVCEVAREDGRFGGQKRPLVAAKIQGLAQALCKRPHHTCYSIQDTGADRVRPDGAAPQLLLLERGPEALKSGGDRGNQGDGGPELPREQRPAGASGEGPECLDDGSGAAARGARGESTNCTDGSDEQRDECCGEEGGSEFCWLAGAEEVGEARQEEGSRERGGVEHGGRGEGREPFTFAVIGLSVKVSLSVTSEEYDSIKLKMHGGGRKFPDWPRQHVIRKPIRKRKKLLAGSDAGAARKAAAEMADLRKQLEKAVAEHEQTKAAFAREMEMHVRAGVRRARITSDATVHANLSKLQAELLFLRRDARAARHLTNQKAKVIYLEATVAERDATISDLKQKLLALEKCDTLHKRRLSNVSNTLGTQQSEQKARTAQLKKQHKAEAQELQTKLVAREAELKALSERSQRMQAEADDAAKLAKTEAKAAAARAKTASTNAAQKLKAAADEAAAQALAASELKKEKAAVDAQMAALEQNCEDTILEMNTEHELALDKARKRVEKLLAALEEQSSTGYHTSVPMGRSTDDFDSLSDAAQRTARHRDIEYATWFIAQREWRVEEWITVMKKQNWLEAFWECKEMWEYRMEWARTLLCTCMSTHFGSKLGLYLALTEHIPSRQIRRINQARYARASLHAC
eukprot:5801076-Pleurochrysis_carterae.AAC.2